MMTDFHMWPLSTLLNFTMLVLSLLALMEQVSWAVVGKVSAVVMLLSFLEGYLRGRLQRQMLIQAFQGDVPPPKLDPVEQLALTADGFLCQTEDAFDQGKLREAVDAYRHFIDSLEILQQRGWNMQQLREYLAGAGNSRSFKDSEYYERMRSQVKAFCAH